MNEINFLPTNFVEQQVRHHRVYREAVWVAVTLMAIAGWYVTSRGSLDSLESYAGALQQEATAVRDQVSEMSKLKVQQKSLLHQVKIQRELVQPLNTTSVLATLAKLMSPSMALTSLELIGTRPVPAPTPPKDPTTGAVVKVDAVSKPRQVLKLELVCLAPSDVDVANFVGRLSDHPLFTNVKMLYSRATVVSNLQAREFRLEMEVPLDRDYKIQVSGLEDEERRAKSEGREDIAPRSSLLALRPSLFALRFPTEVALAH